MANAGQFYQQSEEFVNVVCQSFIEPHEDFMEITCRHKGSDGIGYIKLVDASLTSSFFDITGMSVEQILVLVARIIAGNEVPEMITNYEQRKEVAKLFRH